MAPGAALEYGSHAPPPYIGPYSIPSSSLNPSTKFFARLAETMIPQARASLSSAGVAPAFFAAAKLPRSQVGQPTATAQAIWIILRTFGSRTSVYSKSMTIFFGVVMLSPFSRPSSSPW